MCSSNVETIIHFFWECHIIQDLWNSLKTYLQAKGISIELNLINVLFGINVSSKYSSINFIILLMKYYIFCSKYRQVIPNFTNFEKYLHIRIKIEREIAIMKKH